MAQLGAVQRVEGLNVHRRGERIGFLEAYSIGVGGMIGGGIFAVLGLSLQLAGYAAPVAFLIAGLVALATSYSYAKLSVRYPSEGGTVEFLVRGFGPGLLSGGLNVLLLASYVVMIALYAYAFGSYGASLAGESLFLKHLLAALVIAAFVFVNALGALVSGRVEDALVLFKLGILLVVAGAGLGLVDWGRFSPSNWPPMTSIVTGGMIIFLAYEGFELIANAAQDVKDPRILPRAFYASVITVIAVYVLVAIVTAGVLDLQDVIKYRDYALAAAAEPSLGQLGFYLVVAGALASTSSAINATLYGTARISYIVAKYGQLPRRVERRVWRQAPEGLIIISVLALLLVETASLEAISTAGSGGFLLIFAMVNLAAYRLRREARANPVITLAGFAGALAALAIMLYRMAVTAPTQIIIFAVMLVGSFAAEYIYYKLTGRRLSSYIDYKLELRERNVRKWERWLPRFVRALRRRIKDAEVYLVGSVARGEYEVAHDVDVLVVTRTRLARKELEKIIEEAEREAGLVKRIHPVDVHVAAPEEKEKWLRRSRAYRRIEEGEGGRDVQAPEASGHERGSQGGEGEAGTRGSG